MHKNKQKQGIRKRWYSKTAKQRFIEKRKLRNLFNELTYTLKELQLVKRFGENNTNSLSYCSKVYISFDSKCVVCSQRIKTETTLQKKYCSFDIYSMLVKVIPVFRISWNPRIHSEILVGICISAFSVRGCCARSFTGANACRTARY